MKVKFSLLFCLALLSPLGAFSAPFQASVISAKGKTEVQRDGVWQAISAGSTLNKGDVVQTGFKSELILKIKNSTVTVSPMTRLTVEQLAETKDKDETKLFLDTGSVKSTVKKTEDRRVGFTVRSPVATASVRGTSFSVKNVYGGTEIIGYEGKTSAWKSTTPQSPEIDSDEEESDQTSESDDSSGTSDGKTGKGAVIIRKNSKSSYTQDSSVSPKENSQKETSSTGGFNMPGNIESDSQSQKKSTLLVNITIKE